MPELPEVETVREGVQTHAAGLVIERVRILDARSTRRHVPGTADFAARLENPHSRGVSARQIHVAHARSHRQGRMRLR